MIRITLDVNVLASGFPARAGVPSELIDRWGQGQFTLVLSEHILRGLERAWRKPYYQSRFSWDEAENALHVLRVGCILVEPASGIHGVAADTEDDLVLATAISGSAEYLVTGDKPLQSLGNVQGIAIISPRAFLDILNDE